MNENLEKHIINALEDYEADKNSGHFVYSEEEKKLMNEYEDCYLNFLQMLDDNQKEAFKNYRICLLKRESAIKSEYFTQGFIYGILGLNSRDAFLKI